MSKPCIAGALTVHIIQADGVCRSEHLFLDRAETHSLAGEGVPSSVIPLTEDSLNPALPLSHPLLSCSTLNLPGCLPTVPVHLSTGSLSPLWSEDSQSCSRSSSCSVRQSVETVDTWRFRPNASKSTFVFRKRCRTYAADAKMTRDS